MNVVHFHGLLERNALDALNSLPDELVSPVLNLAGYLRACGASRRRVILYASVSRGVVGGSDDHSVSGLLAGRPVVFEDCAGDYGRWCRGKVLLQYQLYTVCR